MELCIVCHMDCINEEHARRAEQMAEYENTICTCAICINAYINECHMPDCLICNDDDLPFE